MFVSSAGKCSHAPFPSTAALILLFVLKRDSHSIYCLAALLVYVQTSDDGAGIGNIHDDESFVGPFEHIPFLEVIFAP